MAHSIDIIPTPAERRAISRLFRAQQAHAAELVQQAEQALSDLDMRLEGDDDDTAPWSRALLVVAFEALYETESTRVRNLQESLDTFGLDADRKPGDGA